MSKAKKKNATLKGRKNKEEKKATRKTHLLHMNNLTKIRFLNLCELVFCFL